MGWILAEYGTKRTHDDLIQTIFHDFCLNSPIFYVNKTQAKPVQALSRPGLSRPGLVRASPKCLGPRGLRVGPQVLRAWAQRGPKGGPKGPKGLGP